MKAVRLMCIGASELSLGFVIYLVDDGGAVDDGLSRLCLARSGHVGDDVAAGRTVMVSMFLS